MLRSSNSSGRRRKGVIFDFEGTLVDFQWQLGPAETELRSAFAGLGFADASFARGNYATMWNEAVDRLLPQGRMAELRRALGPIYDKWDADALSRWQARPGAVDLLESLSELGLRRGMVSNIGNAALGTALNRFGLASRLTPVLSRNDVNHMKPRTEGILRILADWQAAPEEVLFVGDSLADVAAAHAAGVAVAIIRGGECDVTVFAGQPAEHLITGLDELIGLVAGTQASGSRSNRA